MEQLPNEIIIQILSYLDPISYISFIETGFRKFDLIDSKHYENMKNIYLKNKYKQLVQESIETKDFLKDKGLNTDELDLSGFTPDIISTFTENIYDLIEDNIDDEADFAKKFLERINTNHVFQTEDFQSAMRSVGMSVLNNSGRDTFINNGIVEQTIREYEQNDMNQTDQMNQMNQ